LWCNVTVVLRDLDMADATNVFAAIALAQPGGLGKPDENDVGCPRRSSFSTR
jgi:hypothetical protein